MMLKTVLDVAGLIAGASGALIPLSVRRGLPVALDKHRRHLGFALDLVAASSCNASTWPSGSEDAHR